MNLQIKPNIQTPVFRCLPYLLYVRCYSRLNSVSRIFQQNSFLDPGRQKVQLPEQAFRDGKCFLFLDIFNYSAWLQLLLQNVGGKICQPQAAKVLVDLGHLFRHYLTKFG